MSGSGYIPGLDEEEVDLSPTYNLSKQKKLQVRANSGRLCPLTRVAVLTPLPQACLCGFSILGAAVQVFISVTYQPGQSDAWKWAAVSVSSFAFGVSVFGLVGALTERRILFAFYLFCLMALLMPFRVLYMAFGFDVARAPSLLWYVDLLTSAIVVLLSWGQAYTGTQLLSLLKLKEAFLRIVDTMDWEPGRLPTEELVNLCESLGLHPGMGDVVEMLSILPEGATDFSFHDLCAMFHRFMIIRRRRRAQRSKQAASAKPNPLTTSTSDLDASLLPPSPFEEVPTEPFLGDVESDA
eukprot:scaffold995_cov244-Pinguiococcus_pyrenoidosus.AAC.17